MSRGLAPPLRLGDLPWTEVDALDRDRAVCILPLGAIEAHGPHLPLLTDGIIATAMAEAGAGLLTAHDLLPLVLSGLAGRWDEIRIQEIINYATYDQPQVLFETMGFGQPMDATPLLLTPGTPGQAPPPVAWLPSVSMATAPTVWSALYSAVRSKRTCSLSPRTLSATPTMSAVSSDASSG